jgi:hypothetical protein
MANNTVEVYVCAESEVNLQAPSLRESAQVSGEDHQTSGMSGLDEGRKTPTLAGQALGGWVSN